MNNVRFDIKRGLRATKEQINDLIAQLADPNLTTVTIDGRSIRKSDTITLGLAVSDKTESLSNQSASMVSVLSQYYAMEKQLMQ